MPPRRTAAGQLPTIPPAKQPFLRIFWRHLCRDKKAKAFFESLNKANRYAIAYRLQTAKKPETKQRRMEMILAMLARSEAFHYRAA